MSDREAALAEAYRRGIMKPEQRAAYEVAMRRGLVRGPERTMGQRLLDNLRDGFEHSGAGSILRSMDPGADGLADLRDLTRVRQGSIADRVLTATAGRDREWFASDAEAPTTAEVLTGQGMRGTAAAARERDRRADYAAKAEADPIQNVGDFGAFLAGQVLGGGASPENWVGGGAGRGATALGRVASNAGRQGAIAAGVDVALQGSDIGAGIEDDYSLLRTVGAGALGAGFSAAIDSVRPVSRIVRSAFTDPITPAPLPTLAAPLPEAPPAAPTLWDRITNRPPETSQAALAAAETPVALPEFGIVQPIERRTPLLDTLQQAREGEMPQIVGEALSRAYTAVVSDQHPLVRAVEDMRSQTEALTGAPLDLLPSQDPRKLARGRYDWTALGQQDLLHGVHAYHGLEPTTPALADVVSAVTVRGKRAEQADALLRFNEYLVARRATVEWDRYGRGEIGARPVARSKDDADAFIARMDTEQPHFRELSESVNAFSTGLLTKARDAGLVSQEVFDASVGARDFYVPLRRVMDEPGAARAATASNAGDAVKGFEGSDRDVIDPLHVLTQRTYRLNQRIRQNELNLSLVQMGERLEGLARAAGAESEMRTWLRRVETPSRPVKVSKAELTAQAKGRAAEVDALFDEDGVEAWRPGQINEAGRPILHVWRGGQREAWEIVDETWGREVFDAMAGMSKAMQDTFLNAFAAPTAVLAQTITRDPAFMFANFIRDQVSSWIVTDVGFVPGEGVLGIADELAQTDLTRLYNRSGGISGGAATAMLGDVLHRTDTAALAQRGIKAKYFSSLGGLLATSEISETGTRLRVFKRAFDRARTAGFSEYDALIEASFTARDMIDFGRAGSRMHATRRLVTFLNSQVQGMDKALRVVGADGAMARVPLKDALRPLFGMKVAPGAMRAEDQAALQLAGRAWVKIAAISTFGAAIAGMFRDDPDWQQANERNRATHWVIPWGDTLVRIPKPFELAFLSNIVERGIEAAGGDDRSMERMWRGLGMLFEPPTDIPLVGVVGGLQSNTNSMTGRPIVPEHLQGLPAHMQYQHWSSQFSRWLGEKLEVSPAKIDYAIQGFAGPFGTYLLNTSDAANPDRPSGAWTDAPVLRRFFSPSYRGGQDRRDFYDRAGGRTSDLARALNGVREYQKRGRPEAARAILADLDEPGRLFVLSQMGETATKRLNPLERGRVFAQEASRIIGELNGAMPKDQGVPLPPMSARARQSIEDAVERVAVAELRNAMIVTRQPGFANRDMMDRDGLWQDLRDLSPQVAEELERRLGAGADRAYDYQAVIDFWPRVEQRLRAEGSAAHLDDLAQDARGRTQSWGVKAEMDLDELAPLTF